MTILDPVKFFVALVFISILGQALGVIPDEISRSNQRVYSDILNTIWTV